MAVPLAGLLLTACLAGACLIGAVSPSAFAKRSHAAAVETTEATGGTPAEATAGEEAKLTREAKREARREARAKRRAAKRTVEPASTPAVEEAAEEAPSTIAPAAQNTTKQNTSKRHKEIERERRRARREARKEAKEKSKEPAGEEPPAAGEPSPAPGPAAQPAAIGTTTPLKTSSPPATVGGSHTQAGSGHGAGRTHGAKRAVSSAAPASAGALASRPAAANRPRPAAGTSHGVAAGKAGKAHPASSPLSRTVTRIINVVPGFVRWLVAGLLGLALALALNSRYASRRAERLTRQRRELLADVGLLQAALLPELPAGFSGVGTTAAYRPASGPAAGGDFYDLFALEDGRLALILGDVSGHGRTALPHTTLVRFTLRAYLEVDMAPRAALQAAAPVLERQLEGSFATVVLAIYDPARRTLTYTSAGHPPPVLAGTRPVPQITSCSAPPIGVGWPTGTRQTEISIPGAARICFYTDGVVEAKLDHTLFGVGRLQEVLRELPGDATAAEVLDEVAERADEHPDDMAACLLDVEGGAQAPAVLVEEVEVHRSELASGRLDAFLGDGGLSEAEIESVVTQAAAAVLRDGSVVLRLRPGAGRPRVELAHNNVARTRITARATASATEVAV